jgi:hypothetical protein
MQQRIVSGEDSVVLFEVRLNSYNVYLLF